MAHSRVLLDPEILSDPVGNLEEKLQSGEIAPPLPEMSSPPQKRRSVGNICSDFCTPRSDTNRGGGEAGQQDTSGAATEVGELLHSHTSGSEYSSIIEFWK